MFYLLCSHCIKKLLLISKWDMVMIRDRFIGTVRFKGGLRGRAWVNSVNRCNYTQGYIYIYIKIGYKHVQNKCIVSNDWFKC